MVNVMDSESADGLYNRNQPCITTRHRRWAFTLIELAVVVLLLGLCAAATVWRLRVPYQAARARHDIQRLAMLDDQLRRHASRSGSTKVLVVDLESNTIRISTDVAQRNPVVRLSLSPEFRIAGVWRDGKWLYRGQVTVDYSVHGCSPTWAVHLIGPKTEETRLLFLGLTGQCHELEHERDLHALLQATRFARNDPD
jgi:type II secretory pathway pseudopilin PulG